VPPVVVVKGTRATLRHESDNKKDKNALLVVSVTVCPALVPMLENLVPAVVSVCHSGKQLWYKWSEF
jgi:hypothetical protein